MHKRRAPSRRRLSLRCTTASASSRFNAFRYGYLVRGDQLAVPLSAHSTKGRVVAIGRIADVDHSSFTWFVGAGLNNHSDAITN